MINPIQTPSNPIRIAILRSASAEDHEPMWPGRLSEGAWMPWCQQIG